MRKDTISYYEKTDTLRKDIDYYKRMVRRELLLRIEREDEIKELRLENARLRALVDARFAENDWSESVGTE